MIDTLKKLIGKILPNSDVVITEDSDDYAYRYKIQIQSDLYPILIGKNGLTIKAITSIMKYICNRKNITMRKKVYIDLIEDK